MKDSHPTDWALLRSGNSTPVIPMIRQSIVRLIGGLKSASYAMSELEPQDDHFGVDEAMHDSTHLWVISYSDFMTILMIFFLMLFAHRVWAKKVFWESQKIAQMRAMQEAQKGIVQRLTRLASVEVQAQRINIHLPSALLFESGRADLKGGAGQLLSQICPDL